AGPERYVLRRYADVPRAILAVLLAARRHARNPPRHHCARAGASMSELRTLLADTTEKVLSALPPDDSAAWKIIQEAGLHYVMRPESDGGFGGGWEDAFIVL